VTPRRRRTVALQHSRGSTATIQLHDDEPDARRKVKGFFAVGETRPWARRTESSTARRWRCWIGWSCAISMRSRRRRSGRTGRDRDGELRTENIGTEVFFMPAASHVEKERDVHQHQRLLQWHGKAIEPPEAAAGAPLLLPPGQRIREKLRSSQAAATSRSSSSPGLPTLGRLNEPDAEAVLQENQRPRAGRRVAPQVPGALGRRLDELGSWIHCGIYATASTRRAQEAPDRAGLGGPGMGLGLAREHPDPLQPGLADPDGKPWSERKRYVWWDEDEGEWTGRDHPDTGKPTSRRITGRRRKTPRASMPLRGRRSVHPAPGRARVVVRAGGTG